jgi:hypothetical protein
VLPGRLEWLASDTDRVRQEADERLPAVVSQVETLAPGAGKTGSVGDETPLSAFADAVRRFAPHHILIALRASDHSAWQERQLLDRVREGFHHSDHDLRDRPRGSRACAWLPRVGLANAAALMM